MTLRCKPGDLAIVVGGSANQGCVVEVLEFAGPMHGCIDCWYISHHGQERDPGSGFRWFVPDAEMLPIRPGDLKEVDETEKEVESV